MKTLIEIEREYCAENGSIIKVIGNARDHYYAIAKLYAVEVSKAALDNAANSMKKEYGDILVNSITDENNIPKI